MRWKQACILFMESYTDYLLFAYGHSALKNSSTHPDVQQCHPLLIDEMAAEICSFVSTHQPTLLGMLHIQTYIDTNFTLGSLASRGFAELRAASLRVQEVLAERTRVEGTDKPPAWSLQHERSIEVLKEETQLWTKEECPVTFIRKLNLRRVPEAPPIDPTSLLLPRSPILCGLLLFRNMLKFQSVGLDISNAYATTTFAAHLLVACRHSGGPLGHVAPHWPDMDKILDMHAPEDMFGGKVPETLLESNRSFACMVNGSQEILDMLAKRDAASSKNGEQAALQNYMKLGKGLRDASHLLAIFKEKIHGDARNVRLNLNLVESLLSDTRAHEDKKQRQAAAAVAGSKARRRNLLRQERSHRSAKYSVPQLLSVLEAGLRLEAESIRFDYVSMHLSCLRVLRAVRDAMAPVLSVRKEGMEYQHCDFRLFDMVGHILQEALRSGRVVVRNEVTQAEEGVWSRQVAVASAAITNALALEQNGTLDGLSKMRLDTAAQ